MACRHEGGEEDCPDVCWFLWGDRFTTITHAYPNHNAHRPVTQRSYDFCYGRHCSGQSKG